ncbi:universal stress protein [Rhodococcus rhodochrous]|uniref:universal stress protein n=1 Tax=Rhodococcus rhodochrous TaxID=1829 RepID=UPI00035E25FB|nr:universal stress protein [Rhodococcus rhodochrous]
MNWTVFVVFLIVWVLSGLVTGLWMARRGHDPRWTVIAVILGPLFVPIALERIERTPRSVETAPIARWGAGDAEPGGLRVMVGYDGSTEAGHALRAALQLFGPAAAVFELVAVISYDDGTDPDSAALERTKRTLADAATRAGDLPVGYAVLAGPPGPCLRWFAQDQHADTMVVGKRGRGMSNRMLGSVAEYLTAHCPVPVLVVDPTRTTSSPSVPSAAPVAVRVSAEEISDSDGHRTT